MNTPTHIAIAYIPVLHKGYVDFIKQTEQAGATELWLVGDSILGAHEELDYLNRKDRLRAIAQGDMQKACAHFTPLPVCVVEHEELLERGAQASRASMPREDISTLIKERYLPKAEVHAVDIFLRWHRDNTAENKSVEEQYTLSESMFDAAIMGRVEEEAEMSADWWRQIGAALVKDGEIIALTRNVHEPKDTPMTTFGDPRSLARRGTAIELSLAAHAEGALIAEAARKGTSLVGAHLYVTDFPCPYCARIIAHSGISKVFFKKGYAMLEGDTFLKEAGVEIIRVV